MCAHVSTETKSADTPKRQTCGTHRNRVAFDHQNAGRAIHATAPGALETEGARRRATQRWIRAGRADTAGRLVATREAGEGSLGVTAYWRGSVER